MGRFRYVALLGISLVLYFQAVHGQSQIISNGSFEGTPSTGIPPQGWSPCHNYSTPDTQPGSWGVTQSASDGNTYISLVTRGATVESANTTENIQSELLKIMLRGNEYHLTIDLSYSEIFQWEAFSYTTPAKLQIFGGSTSCSKEELLWESPPINHTDWRTYSIGLKPTKTSVKYLIFEAQYIAESTSGNILLDNLNMDICDFASPIITKPFDRSVCEGTIVVLDASSPEATFRWSDGSTEPIIEVDKDGIYRVDVSNGCETKTFEYDIEVKACLCEATLPNVFTPNGDGINEAMEIKTESSITTFSLMIFDRAGGEVFRTENINNPWTGDKNGKQMPVGTYFWTLSMTCFQGNKHQENGYKGWVQIIR